MPGRSGARKSAAKDVPWEEIARLRREGWTFRKLRQKFGVSLATLHKNLTDRLGAFPGDPARDPREDQARLEDAREPDQIAWDALMSGLRKVERQIKERYRVDPRHLESLLRVHQGLEARRSAGSEMGELQVRAAELLEQRRQLNDSIEELDRKTGITADETKEIGDGPGDGGDQQVRAVRGPPAQRDPEEGAG